MGGAEAATRRTSRFLPWEQSARMLDLCADMVKGYGDEDVQCMSLCPPAPDGARRCWVRARHSTQRAGSRQGRYCDAIPEAALLAHSGHRDARFAEGDDGDEVEPLREMRGADPRSRSSRRRRCANMGFLASVSTGMSLKLCSRYSISHASMILNRAGSSGAPLGIPAHPRRVHSLWIASLSCSVV